MTVPMSRLCSRESGLLDNIAAKCGCSYLSDLVYTDRDDEIKSALRSIHPDDFSVQEWMDVIEYLTRETAPPFVSQLDAALYLLSRPSYYKYAAQKF